MRLSFLSFSLAAGEILENKAEIKVGCLSCLLGHILTPFFNFNTNFGGALLLYLCIQQHTYVVFAFADETRLSGFSVPIIRRAKLASYESQKGMGIRIKNRYVDSYSDIPTYDSPNRSEPGDHLHLLSNFLDFKISSRC